MQFGAIMDRTCLNAEAKTYANLTVRRMIVVWYYERSMGWLKVEVVLLLLSRFRVCLRVRCNCP